MLGVIGVIAFLTLLGLSLIITRLATVALVLTGLSHEAARFQALSAFTGTGFTTREAERVVDHPVRRRLIMILIILRSAGLVTVILSLILSFADTATSGARIARLLWLTGGVAVLFVLTRIPWVDAAIERAMAWALRHWTDLEVRDYVGLLKLSGSYRVMEVNVRGDDWLAGKTIREACLDEEGVTVLGIYRDEGGYLGAPKADTRVRPGDTLLLYGRAGNLQELSRRRSGATGEAAHQDAVREQEAHEAEEQQEERTRDTRRAQLEGERATPTER